MFKFNLCFLMLVSSLSYAKPSDIDPIDRVVCLASVQGVKVDLTRGGFMTAPPSYYLEGTYTNYDDQKRFKSAIEIFVRETEPGIISAFFTLIASEAGARINLGGSRFRANQELDTWVGIPGTGTAENPHELHLSCRKK